MSHDAGFEKCALARNRSIDYLIRNHQGPRREFLTQASHSTQTEEMCGPKSLERKYICPIGTEVGEKTWPAPWRARKRTSVSPIFAFRIGTAGRAKRCLQRYGFTGSGSFQIVDSASADHS